MYKLVSFILLCISFNASANLILNGDFEDKQIKRKWQYLNADKVNGWQGERIEVWHGLFGLKPYSGKQHIELNSHKKDNEYAIYQTFNSQAGQSYDLSFAYAARTRKNEQFLVEVFSGQNLVMSQLINDHAYREWSVFTDNFVATDSQTTLKFTGITPKGSVGNLLDDIQVNALNITAPQGLANAVDAPATIGLLLLAGGLLVMRHKRAASTK
ncbi:DUF642 domain-containing protein [Catenovulum sp. SM1970]|uniref:DUF642 domain-containing protein n=1 Tax=Marinifaba aquimaris TaxID=2741323 RepID=UPI00157342FF|nr:DUF642 domain-containing protein [Marinifaba aquimaris]NTS77439.1 DUF642 domain-containing protein [Marinifaba aquimaris]